MSQPYVARYTPCGHSIKQLRDDAKRLKRSGGIRHREALDRLARDLKYSNWDELINQKSDSNRDDFFQGMFQDRKDSEITRNLYAEFLRLRKLSDSKDTYRLFVLQHWKSYDALGMRNLELDGYAMHPDVMQEELTVQINKHGARGLLPQNMGARLLESTILAGRILMGDKGQVPDEIFQGYLATLMVCLSGIRAYQLKSKKIAFSEDEFIAQMEQYYLLAEMELMSRRTGLRFSLPDIDEALRPDAKLSFRFPEAVREIMMAND